MKYALTIALAMAAGFYGWVQFGAADIQGNSGDKVLTATVVGVIDGDSIKVRAGDTVHRIELDGIDAPEIGQPFGDISKNYLIDLIDGREITVRTNGVNDYGDIVGEVVLNDVSINRLMLTDGFAWAKRGLFEDPAWAGLESLARNKGFGLWRNGTPEAPWKYREGAGQSS